MPQVRVFSVAHFVCALVAFVGIIQFLVTAFYLATHYPEPYQWHLHFISDLGRTVTQKEFDNTKNSRLFGISCLVLGGALLPFLWGYSNLFRRSRWFLRFLAILIIGALIGIGQTPYDQYYVLHHVFLVLWIAPMAILAITLTILIWIEGGSSLILLSMSGLLVATSIIYLSIGSHSGYVILQKIVVLVSVGWMVAVSSMIMFVWHWVPSDRQRAIAVEADWYDRQLQKRQKRKMRP